MNSIQYRVIRRGQPGVAGGGDQKYYAFIKREREITLREIVKEIAGRSTLTTGDTMNVIENFLDMIPRYLRRGHPVDLGEFGNFRINLSSKGHDTPDKVSIFSIRGTRVLFTPAREMRFQLADLRFMKADGSTSYEEEEGQEAA